MTGVEQRTRKAIAGTFGASALLAIAVFVLRTLRSPDGGWDAWMIWNLRARWLLGSRSFAGAFPPALAVTQPDYPLLLPTLVAAGWRAVGNQGPAVPVALSAGFALLYVAVVVVAVARRRGMSWGLLAGTLVLSTPMFVQSAPDQCADIPLGAFLVLGAVALLGKGAKGASESPSDRVTGHALAGLAFSMAALTKNEGLIYAGACLLAIACTQGVALGARVRDASAFVLGAAPGLAALGWFKLRYAPPNPLFAQTLGALLQRAAQPERWGLVVLHVARRFVYFQGWTLLALAVVPIASSLSLRASAPLGLRRVGVTLALALVAFLAAYLVTPYDLAWHIDHSFDRLLLQQWGAWIVILLLSVPAAPTAETVQTLTLA